MKITNNLKFYRQQKQGLTQAKLAKLVGISETHYQKIEYGTTKPSIYTALKLMEILEVNEIKELFPLPSEKNIS